MSKKKSRKKPAKKINLTQKRAARGIKRAEKYDNALLAWNTDTIDIGGKWSWNDINPKIWFRHICPAKHAFSKMRWSEIVGDRHHSIDVNKIMSEAQKRLIHIEQDDVDVLYSLAIGSKPRIWGIRDRNVFKVLWWDPKHEICPSPKNHT